MIDCLNCLNMKIKKEKAKCARGHFYIDTGEKIFNCKKQLERYDKVIGFSLWEKGNCIDFNDMDEEQKENI